MKFQRPQGQVNARAAPLNTDGIEYDPATLYTGAPPPKISFLKAKAMFYLPAIKGLLLMLSTIVAIGPQNAFLLRQAVRRDQVWLAAWIFLFGDVTMVCLGGFGIGHFLESWPWVKLILTCLGALYIFWFGLNVFRQSLHPKGLNITSAPLGKSIIAGALAVTFLNPHAILDTIILIGTMALHFQGTAKIMFISGAILGSAIWFLGVAWTGQRLAPFLSRPEVWRIIDMIIVAVMLIMAVTLAVDAWNQGRLLLS